MSGFFQTLWEIFAHPQGWVFLTYLAFLLLHYPLLFIVTIRRAVLLCLLGSLFKPSRRQAVASSPVVEPRFLVALQTAIHVAANPLRTMAVQKAVQQSGDHRLHLRNRQRRGPFLFPARFPA